MARQRTAQEVFQEWGQDHRAEDMEDGHWPTVRQAFALIADSPGDYLEVGVGSGYGLAHMADKQFAEGRCLGLDISTAMADRARTRTRGLTNVAVEEGDFLDWDPSDERRFTLIFSMEVFYYFSNIAKGLRHAFDLLTPGGQLWVLVNYYRENSISHDWPRQLDTPMQLWSMDDYRAGFESAGFETVRQRVFFKPPHKKRDVEDDGKTLCTYGTRPRAA